MARSDPRNHVRYWTPASQAGLSCLKADFSSHAYARHSHEALVVAVTEEGGSQFESRGVADEADMASLLVFNPDEPHSGRLGSSRRWRYRGFYLAQPALDALQQTLGLSRTPYFSASRLRDPGLIQAFADLHRQLEQGAGLDLQQELFAEAFGRLVERHASPAPGLARPPKDQAKVATVQALMRERHLEALPLEELATGVGLTVFQLIGAFRRCTGTTPHAWLAQLRLRIALAALRRGQPIAQAAATAGFYDQSALSHACKRAYGLTPQQFARAWRGR